MLEYLLLAVLQHHGEAADPDLLHWIKGVLDQLVGAGPWLAVALLAILVIAIPAGIVVFYLWQQRRAGLGLHQSTHRR